VYWYINDTLVDSLGTPPVAGNYSLSIGQYSVGDSFSNIMFGGTYQGSPTGLIFLNSPAQGATGPTGATGVTGPYTPAVMQFIPSAGTPTIISPTSFILNPQNGQTFVSNCVTTPRINYQANGIYLSCGLPAVANENILNIGISGEGIGWTAYIAATNNGTNNSLTLNDSTATRVGSSINYTPADIFTMYADGFTLTLTVYSTYAGQGTTVITMPLTISLATYMRFFADNPTANTYTITQAFYMPTGLRGVGATGSTGPTGPIGVGIPTGGTAGQVLSKIDSANYNIQWNADMAFIAAYSVNWATSDPTTIGSAINRMAALLSTMNTGPIP